MLTAPENYTEAIQDFIRREGRQPDLLEMLELAREYPMSDQMKEEQKKSFIRGTMPTGDPRLD